MFDAIVSQSIDWEKKILTIVALCNQNFITIQQKFCKLIDDVINARRDDLSKSERELIDEGFEDYESIVLLDGEDLDDIGVEKKGHRKKILHNVEKLKSSAI